MVHSIIGAPSVDQTDDALNCRRTEAAVFQSHALVDFGPNAPLLLRRRLRVKVSGQGPPKPSRAAEAQRYVIACSFMPSTIVSCMSMYALCHLAAYCRMPSTIVIRNLLHALYDHDSHRYFTPTTMLICMPSTTILKIFTHALYD